MSSRKILIFIDWFYPAYKAGGPVKSVFNLVSQLKEAYEFQIITSNQDVDGELLNVPVNEWTVFQGVKVIYLTKDHQNRKQYAQLFEKVQPELIYYNSLFSFRFTILPYLLFKSKKIIQMIAPRGMLGEGALTIKPYKKKIFLGIAKKFIFEKQLTRWHATSEQEAKELKSAFGSKLHIRIAKNLSSDISPRSNKSKQTGELKLVFVSRIAEKKNLFFILKLLTSLEKDKHIHLSIYGPIEDHPYWNKCEPIIKENPNISYKGVLKPEEISETLQQYHFYILPTLHENYGHAIAEAILSGVPVILSQQTPWRGLQAAGIGADMELNLQEDWLNYLHTALAMNQAEYESMVQSCFSYAKEHILNAQTIEDSKRLFLVT